MILIYILSHISELEEMHKVAENNPFELARPTVIFSHIDKFEILELEDAETKTPENLQDNGATPSVLTQTSLPHSPLEDVSVSPSASPP